MTDAKVSALTELASTHVDDEYYVIDSREANVDEKSKRVKGANLVPDDAITEAKILAGAVTTNKIKDLAVTQAKIAADAVGENELSTDAVTEVKIKDGAVTQQKLAAGVGVPSVISSGGGAVNLGTVTLSADRITAVAPSGYSHYPNGTLLIFKIESYSDPSWTGSIAFYIGTDRYDLYQSNTVGITYADLETDTSYLAVVNPAVQLIGPVELPSSRQIGDRAFSNPPTNLTDTEKIAVRTAVGVLDETSIQTLIDNIVVTSGAFNTAGTQLILTLADNSTVVIVVPSVLRTGMAAGVDTAGVKQLIKDALTAAVTSNTETGIIVTYNADGTIDFVVSSTPVQTHTNYVGITSSALSAVSASDFTVSGVAASLIIPTYSGTRRLLFARPASEPDPTQLYLYRSGQRNTQNQIHTFDKSSSTILLNSVAHNWWGTVDLQNNFGGFVLEQVN